MSDIVLGKTLDFDGNQLVNLFRRTFGLGYLDNHQKSLAGFCYQSTLTVQERLSSYGYVVQLIYPKVQVGQGMFPVHHRTICRVYGTDSLYRTIVVNDTKSTAIS